MDFLYEENRIYLKSEDGKVIAEVTFPQVNENTVDINHTFVDESLRGKGVAAELLQRAYEQIKKQNKKAKLSCSYAIKWFEKNEVCRDILE